MADGYVDIIRTSTRNILSLNRRNQREQNSDVHRPVKNISITNEAIQDIANKLKRKSQISVSDLQTLKNGLMHDQKYIELVLNCHGALRGIVRELTGHNAQRQYAAVGCCCNLALGDVRACTAVAKAAGSYLITGLCSLNTELAITAAWALGNLAGSSPRVCAILVSQGALAKSVELLNKEELSDAALYTLQHFAYQMNDDLRSDYLYNILNALTQLDINFEVSKLLFMLSCHNEFPAHATDELLLKLVSELPTSIEEHLNCSETNICCRLVYIIRILANASKCDAILNYFTINNYSSTIKSVLCTNNEVLKSSLLWLLGNLFNSDNNHVFFKLLLS